MADLNEIEEFLNISLDNVRLRHGKKYHNKNQYYWFRNQYYIIEASNNKWFIMSSNDNTRDLLRKYIWRKHNQNYIMTGTNSQRLHRILMNDPNGLIIDHINRKPYDNRLENLRIVTTRQNLRNCSISKNNTTGTTGVIKQGKKWCYYVARINDNNGNRLSKSFSIKKYGEEEAKRMAIEQRNIWKQELNYQGE